MKVVHEPQEVVKTWPHTMENCYFCRAPTRYWYEKTNTPVCPICADKHKVSEIKK